MIKENDVTISFTSDHHRKRFLQAVQQLDKVDEGKIDREYGAAIYLLSAENQIWQGVQYYLSRTGIKFAAMLDELPLSSGEAVLLQIAGNLFNDSLSVNPIELLRLDERNFNLALSAIKMRRYGLYLKDLQ
jgi:hypothetical protein